MDNKDELMQMPEENQINNIEFPQQNSTPIAQQPTITPIEEQVANTNTQNIYEQPMPNNFQESVTVDTPTENVNMEQGPINNETNIELNGQEQVVFEYTEKKDFSIWFYIIFFSAVGAIIYFLPAINESLDKFKNSKISVAPTTNNTNTNANNGNSNNNTDNSNNENNKPNDTDNNEQKYYEVSESTIISIDKLTLSNFKKEADTSSGLHYLTFDIENKDNTPYNYKNKIFIQAFSDNEYLSSALLESDSPLPASSKSTLKLLIPYQTYSKDFKILVKKMLSADYPEITLQTNDKEQQTLSCSLKTRNIVYTFANNNLIGISEQINNSSSNYQSNEEYINNLNEYRNKINNFNMISGISANIQENASNYIASINIDPATVTASDIISLNENTYYIGNTNAKIIAYEMKARGYTCN